MKKTRSAILTITWLAICIITLSSFSYAWIRREWRPTIYQDNIKIQAGNALAILMEDGRTLDSINLNDVVNANNSFRLTQVSNLTGWSDDFFRIDVVKDVQDATIFHIDKTDDRSYTQLGADNGYVEIRFQLVSEAKDDLASQQIFLSGQRITHLEDGTVEVQPGSYIRIPPDALEGLTEEEELAVRKKYEDLFGALRISISIEGVAGSDQETGALTYCFYGQSHTFVDTDGVEKDYVHQGVTNTMVGSSYVANNQPLYDGETLNAALVGVNSSFVDLSSYYIPVYDGVPVKELPEDPNDTTFVPEPLDVEGDDRDPRFLFQMAGKENRNIIVRIWLEGHDPGCTSDIAGLDFDLNIQFDSYDPNARPEQGTN